MKSLEVDNMFQLYQQYIYLVYSNITVAVLAACIRFNSYDIGQVFSK